MVTSYFDPGTKLVYAVGAVVGLIGPGAAHRWEGDRKQGTVLRFDRPVRSAEHPTMKPVKLFDYLIRNSSRPGDIVLDPFAGSGTPLAACEQSLSLIHIFDITAAFQAAVGTAGNVAKLDTSREAIEYISLDKLEADPGNFYRLTGLEDLAANIELCGLQQPVRVRPTEGGRYMIVSGHRRRAALALLAKAERVCLCEELAAVVVTPQVFPAMPQ